MLATKFLQALPFALFFSSVVGATPTTSPATSSDTATPTPSMVTAQRIYHEIVDYSPFLTDRTVTLTWTATPDPTSLPDPTSSD